MKQPVVITGMGIVCSIGSTIRTFAQSLKDGKSGIGRLHYEGHPPIPVSIGAEINDFSFDALLKERSCGADTLVQKAQRAARRSPYAVQCSVIAALEAWKEAMLHEEPIPSGRIGVIIAGQNLTSKYQYGLYEKFTQNPEYLNPRYALHFMDTDQVGTLSEIFAIQGEGCTVGGASASGNVAIIKGMQLIQLGIVDACMVVGSMADLSPMEIQGFCSIGAMGGKRFADQPFKACRPFDRDHEGFIYGQGCGCLILESGTCAEHRKIKVMAEIAGGALLLDGNRLSDPNEEGEMRAMESVMGQARLKVSDIDYINTHGTSSPLGDETEIRAIRRTFNKRVSDIWINATKGLTGHCLYAAGIIECIATIIQMREGYVHPNINLDNPIDPQCRFCGKSAVQADIKKAISNSFGFGGINTSILLNKGD
ncbi:MAG: beta-ketoacyl synthase N-terminal-like domain-containing protein [bacterium]